MEELTQLIRQHTSSAGAEAFLQQPSLHSPIHHAVEQVQEEVLERLLIEREDKKYVVSIMSEFVSKVQDALNLYVDSTQTQALQDLLTTGTTAERIRFTGSGRQLGEFFYRLKKKGFLEGGENDVDLAEWLSRYFFSWNHISQSLSPVKKITMHNIFKEDSKPKKPIKLV
jgi:hypothetical protein